jgi:hypothetical protein
MLKATQPQNDPEIGVENLRTEVEYRSKLQEIGNRINSARDLDEILIDLKDDIVSLFNAERLTVYVVDGVKRELVSRFKSGNEIAEIRLPIMGVALQYNQKRIAARGAGRTNKYDYLLENHLLTQKELTKAISDARPAKRTGFLDPDEGFQDFQKGNRQCPGKILQDQFHRI